MLPTIVRNRRNAVPSIIDELLSDNFLPGFFNNSPAWRESTKPAVNVEETEKEFLIDVAAPGVNKEDLKVSVDEGVLTISSENKSEKEEESDGLIRREFSFNSFSRSFNLPENTNADKVSAKHKNGVLHLSIPKVKEEVIPAREIKIS